MSESYLLEIEKLHKQFSGVPVLKGVDMALKAGEVYAIVGGNGAGKSTLMKIITGLYKPDSGVIKVRGKQVSFSNTHEAHLHGIYLVPQEPLIFPNMTVEENIIIGLTDNITKIRKKIDDIIEKLGWRLDLQRKAHSLAIAEQQLVEIIRGLVREADILILDEPTSTLTFGEIESLFKTIKQLTSEGVGIFYITHRFPEIFALADKVAVLRDGVISAHGPISEFTYDKLLEGLVPDNSNIDGLNSETTYLTKNETNPTILKNNASNVPALSVSKLSGKNFSDIYLQIFPGEILGIAGVVGAGRTELAEAIFGIEPIEEGTVILGEKEINKLSIRQRINNGLVYVPEDRHSHGIFSITSIKKNITSTILHRLQGLLLPFRREQEISSKYVEDLKIKTTSIDQELQKLSGGNQQKVVLSKYLAAKPKVIILDEPTRGIDANARNDIYKIIQNLKNEGLAVLLISSDMEEIEKLSDRVIVMHEGKIVKTLEKSEITVDEITKFAFGVKKGVSA
ncbi:autoinducer 2 ABC transporter ATP-binding protein LsrA [Parageobacillus thermoglucosidasius]|uniref:autoinducer 2 ABC transporter ATP-binding protein LsrA n=1 Tax=Parageobacillus thermoglucosidasius TaxID=1426 RepID=UPI002E218C78|nr:autoinducer 2 ABC transporter ATP-binding protein LsrA [Parageobacillus thermoglucosidasius]MED4905399.1 autoinducer 2 ABC transporter ATP-binding protein LsrA [Parageobacillus thermoglucosidasius]MED4913798.1 autoinducer 2 ABC transporter ATP-binding protein LsrA [Parageobacillus thermoglucosidasius]MED4946133.1 autoinducer 2 ABC transporter ATP-binding protein LsrA [Parageobacillus thermoglucosidasius]MED4984008.1 autoinducer 2 ABC transporter ATP-binding protein LsrA [Parageobacillus ther